MGIFDSVKAMAEGYISQGGGDHAAVAGGLMESVEQAGGIGGVLQTMQQNGAGGLVQQWANGNLQNADPNAVAQSIEGTGLIENIAQRTGMSPDTIKSGLATVLPMVIQHMTANGHVTPEGQPGENPAPDSGSLLQSVLGKLL